MKFSFVNIKNLTQLLNYLNNGLNKLSFENNFNGFIVEKQSIPANSEIFIKNTKGTNFKYMTILYQTGNGLVTAGDQAWTTERLTLKNNGSNDIIVTVLFS